MKTKLIVILSMFFVSSSISFASQNQNVSKCPSVSSIRAVGLDYAEEWQSGSDNWAAFKLRSSYDTNAEWTLSLMTVKASNSVDAIKIANKLLPTLMPMGGPMEKDGGYLCYYMSYSNTDVGVFAVSPPIDTNSFKQFRK